MPIFNIQNSKLSLIKEKEIKLERDIQRLTEENLALIFELQFVSTEFSLQNFRIDTLAFDEEAKAFVVIEYKRDRSFSVVDQGYAYLALMLNNKADFILEYNEQTKRNLKREDIDWSQSRVVFVAQSFTTYQQTAINFRDLPIELWEVKLFDNSTILYNQLLSSQTTESIKTITKNKTVESVSKEVHVFTLQDHLEKMNEDTRAVFEILREQLLALGSDVKEVPKKLYVAYKTSTNFVDVTLLKKEIRITMNLRSGELNDPKQLATDFTKPVKGHWGNGDYEINVRTAEDLPYAMILIEQAYKKAQAT